jgi:hypothetical protein
MHVAQTLPANIRDNSDARFVLMNYNSPDGLLDYVVTNHHADIRSGKLVVYTFVADGPFHMTHAKNLAARAAIREGAGVLVTLDADNFTGPCFDRFVADRMQEPGVFLRPDFETIRKRPNRPQRGFAGRLAVRAQDFIKAGGYNEAFDTWGGEDADFNERMGRMGYTSRFIDTRYLSAIPHNAEVRFREYPHARQHEVDESWRLAVQRYDTVVNWGRFGVGTVYRNGDPTPITLAPIPTRVFGIGLHKTATTSLHRAFQLLGFDSLHWGSGEAPVIWEEVNCAGRSKTLERFYAACDLPIPLLYRQLDRAYPGSKFVLTVRAEAEWLRSVERLWDARYNATRWEWDVWPISNRLHQTLYGRTDFDATTMLERYRRHNAEVRDYFRGRPEDLLVLDMSAGAGWPELCGFLGSPVPLVPYPREYATKLQEGIRCST